MDETKRAIGQDLVGLDLLAAHALLLWPRLHHTYPCILYELRSACNKDEEKETGKKRRRRNEQIAMAFITGQDFECLFDCSAQFPGLISCVCLTFHNDFQIFYFYFVCCFCVLSKNQKKEDKSFYFFSSDGLAILFRPHQ